MVKEVCIRSNGCPWFRWLTDFKDTSYIVPSVFQCVLDMDAGTLGFMADGQWLGTAFSGFCLEYGFKGTLRCFDFEKKNRKIEKS